MTVPIMPCSSAATTLTFVLRLIDAELALGDSAHDKLSFDPETDAEENVGGDLWRFTQRKVREKAAATQQQGSVSAVATHSIHLNDHSASVQLKVGYCWLVHIPEL